MSLLQDSVRQCEALDSDSLELNQLLTVQHVTVGRLMSLGFCFLTWKMGIT